MKGFFLKIYTTFCQICIISMCKWLITILKICKHYSSKCTKIHIGIKHSTSICSLCKSLPFPIWPQFSLGDTACSKLDTTSFVCFLGFFLFVFPPLLYNSNYLGALKHWTAPPDTKDFLHTTGDVSVRLNKPYPVKLLLLATMESTFILFCQKIVFFLYTHQHTYSGQFYIARVAALSGFQDLSNNTDIPKNQMRCGLRDGHYCKTNCLYGNNLFVISDNAV